MGVVLMVHSIVRWLVVAVGIIVAVRTVMVMSGQSGSKMDRGLMSGFTGLLDLNVLLGAILILGLGFTTLRIEHAVTNLVGVMAAHIFVARARKIEDSRRRAQFHLLGVVVSLVIIVVGVSMVGGWGR